MIFKRKAGCMKGRPDGRRSYSRLKADSRIHIITGPLRVNISRSDLRNKVSILIPLVVSDF